MDPTANRMMHPAPAIWIWAGRPGGVDMVTWLLVLSRGCVGRKCKRKGDKQPCIDISRTDFTVNFSLCASDPVLSCLFWKLVSSNATLKGTALRARPALLSHLSVFPQASEMWLFPSFILPPCRAAEDQEKHFPLHCRAAPKTSKQSPQIGRAHV